MTLHIRGAMLLAKVVLRSSSLTYGLMFHYYPGFLFSISTPPRPDPKGGVLFFSEDEDMSEWAWNLDKT